MKGFAVRPWRAVLSMATRASTDIGPSPTVASLLASDDEVIETESTEASGWAGAAMSPLAIGVEATG